VKHLLHILIALPLFAWGQGNLVPNPSFEVYTDCPEQSTWIHYALPWVSSGATVCSPDYFNACANQSSGGVPENGAGFQHARTGLAYAGFYAYEGWLPEGREYIQVELMEPVHAGVRYEVSFHVSLADKFWYAVGSLGAYFSDTLVTRQEFYQIIDVEPHIQSPEGVIYTSKTDWMEVRDTFNSRYGGERFMVIGNFKTDVESNITFVDSGATISHTKSYYYIDDVSVIALDSIPDNIAEQEQMGFDVWPNPASDVQHIQSRMPFARLRLLDISGRAVLSEHIVTDRHTLQLSGIPPGLYLLEATDTEGRSAVRKVVVQ